MLELAGAAGLLLPRTVPWAAGGLAALLVVMSPANACAALEGFTLDGAPATAPVPRTLLQLVLLAATLAVLIACVRERRLARGAIHGASPRGRTLPSDPRSPTA